MLNYDKDRNEVTVTGCRDCPFLRDTPREKECYLTWDLLMELNGFPEDCPLRDPNFKLTRVFKDKENE